MKRLVLWVVLACVFASAAWAFPARYFTRSATGTGSTPTTAPVPQCNLCVSSFGDGLSIENVVSVDLAYCADSGNLQAVGTLLAYSFDRDANAWMRSPVNDRTITLSGVACQTFGSFFTGSRTGGIVWVPSGVTFSAGTTGTVRMLACTKNTETEACR